MAVGPAGESVMLPSLGPGGGSGGAAGARSPSRTTLSAPSDPVLEPPAVPYLDVFTISSAQFPAAIDGEC